MKRPTRSRPGGRRGGSWRVAALLVPAAAGLALGLLPGVAAAQDPPLQRRAGLVVERVSLNDALLALRRSAGVSIAFSPDVLPPDLRVTCRCASVTVGEALRRLLEGTALTYRGTDTQVLVFLAEPAPAPAPRPPSRDRSDLGVIRGHVVTDGTGEPVSYATARLETGQGALADASGLFLVRGVPPGPHTLRVMSIGFEPWVLDGIELGAADTAVVSVPLRRAAIRLPELVVAPGTFGLLEATPPGTATAMSRQQVQVLPQLGEDVFRAMSRLPGVTSSDISTRLNVRGSLAREVSTRLDGLELYDPYHLGDWEGVFGIIDLNALGGATLNAGGFGVEYGGKAGAVMDMTSSPVLGLPRTNLGLTLSNATALGQGGFARDRGTWLVSGRRGSLGLLMKLVGADDRLSPQFYDGFAKVVYQVAPGHLLSARFLRAADDFSLRVEDWDGVHPVDGLEEATLDTRWASTYGWVTWEARAGSGLAATTMVWTGRLSRFRDGFMVDVGRVGIERASAVDDRGFTFFGARHSLAVELGPRTVFLGGAEALWGDASYGYERETETPVLIDGVSPALRFDTAHVAIGRSGHQLAAWAAVRARPVGALTLEAGLRYDRASHSGDENLAPRLLASLALGARTTVQASLGRYVQSQGMHELNVSDGETEYAPAELSNMAAVGVAHRLGSFANARLDLYRRVTNVPRPQYLNLEHSLRVFPEAETDRWRIDPMRGRAEGVELSLHGRAGAAWEWSAGYVLSQAEDELGEAQRCGSEIRCAGAGWVPRSRDQRHAVNARVSYRPNDRWHLTAMWLFHSGWPATAWAFDATELPDGSLFWSRTFGPVHGERLPGYHRLDLRATRAWNVGSGRLEVFLDVFNAYGRANEVALHYAASYVNGAARTVRGRGESMLPFLPSVGVRYQR